MRVHVLRRATKLGVILRAGLLWPLLPALGWGPIAHISINGTAYRRAKEAGANLPARLERYFANSGTSPDFISMRAEVTGDRGFDYAHNLLDPVTGEILDVDRDGGRSQAGRPAFGETLIAVSRRGWLERSWVFALGWTGHQLADRQVHGEAGYVNNTPPFPGLARLLGPKLSERLGPHGLNEIAIDALVLQKDAPSLRVSVPVRPFLLCAASRRFLKTEKLRGRILWPWVSWTLARSWQAVVRGGEVEGLVAVADLMSRVDHPLWPRLAEYYEVTYPYTVPWRRAVQDVTTLLVRAAEKRG